LKKFRNHLDHVAWVSRPETLAANTARLAELSGAAFQSFVRADMGIVITVSWEAGLEILSPLPERTPGNQALHDHLDAHGEGIFAVVFGVGDLEGKAARLEAHGHAVSGVLDDHPASPWHHKLHLRERVVGPFLGGNFVLGDIDYADDVVDYGAA
jgi:hypothetical protein